MNQRKKWHWRERGKNQISFEKTSITESLCIWIAVSLLLEMCASCFLNCSKRTSLLFIIPQNKQQIMCETWNQRGKVFCSLSHCRSVAEGGGRLVDPQFPLLRHYWLFSIAAAWKGTVRVPAGFPGVFLILRALANGWQGWPGCLCLLLLN